MIKSRLLNHAYLERIDEDYEPILAGSTEEFDLIYDDWSREELVETIQELDKKLLALQERHSGVSSTRRGQPIETKLEELTERIEKLELANMRKI